MKSKHIPILAILAVIAIIGLVTVNIQQISAPRGCSGCPTIQKINS